jgi:hypothetical protein
MLIFLFLTKDHIYDNVMFHMKRNHEIELWWCYWRAIEACASHARTCDNEDEWYSGRYLASAVVSEAQDHEWVHEATRARPHVLWYRKEKHGGFYQAGLTHRNRMIRSIERQKVFNMHVTFFLICIYIYIYMAFSGSHGFASCIVVDEARSSRRLLL